MRQILVCWMIKADHHGLPSPDPKWLRDLDTFERAVRDEEAEEIDTKLTEFIQNNDSAVKSLSDFAGWLETRIGARKEKE